MKPNVVVLRNERSSKGSRHLSAHITEAGDLKVEGHDLGPGVEEVLGAGVTEYEWTIVVRKRHLPRVIAALGGEENDGVLSLLAARFSVDEQCASKAFLEQHGVPVDFWNRAGE
jgi:hypothetical protein